LSSRSSLYVSGTLRERDEHLNPPSSTALAHERQDDAVVGVSFAGERSARGAQRQDRVTRVLESDNPR
jgi:hypothetical protein